MTSAAAIIRRYDTREEVRGFLGSRGFEPTLEGWRNGRWIGRVSRDDSGFWVEVWLPTASGSSFERKHLMIEQDIADSRDHDAALLRGPQAPVVRFETLVASTAPVGMLDGGVNLDPPRWQESSPEEAVLGTHGRFESRQNRTGTPVAKILRELAQI
jgi:hypothetical protein